MLRQDCSRNKLLLKTFCVCVKRMRLCHCLCSSSCCDSASLIRNIGGFAAKNYFTDHRIANTIHSFRDSVPVLKIHSCYQDTQESLSNFPFLFQQPSNTNTRRLRCAQPLQTAFNRVSTVYNYSNCIINQSLSCGQMIQPIFVAK